MRKESPAAFSNCHYEFIRYFYAIVAIHSKNKHIQSPALCRSRFLCPLNLCFAVPLTHYRQQNHQWNNADNRPSWYAEIALRSVVFCVEWNHATSSMRCIRLLTVSKSCSMSPSLMINWSPSCGISGISLSCSDLVANGFSGLRMCQIVPPWSLHD